MVMGAFRGGFGALRPISFAGLGLAFSSGCEHGSTNTPRLAEPAPEISSPTTELCQEYDSLTAAIAAWTIECRDTIGPDSFRVDADGYLQRNFDECTSSSVDKLVDIDNLLSVQQREPRAQSCMADRWQIWEEGFRASGIQTCPRWEKLETINAPTARTVAALITKTAASLDRTREMASEAHENYAYRVRYPNGTPASCKDAASCAAECAGGFAGFTLEADGDRVIGDPSYWLLSVRFTPVTSNPFRAPGYCHPMAAAGDIYAHRSRVGECCIRNVTGENVALTLVCDCLDYTVPSTCVTVCREPLEGDSASYPCPPSGELCAP